MKIKLHRLFILITIEFYAKVQTCYGILYVSLWQNVNIIYLDELS